MNAIYYCLTAYELISWIWIVISLWKVPNDVGLCGEQVE